MRVVGSRDLLSQVLGRKGMGLVQCGYASEDESTTLGRSAGEVDTVRHDVGQMMPEYS